MAEPEGRFREEICRYCHLLYERRLVGAAGGNVSARLPGAQRILITPSGVSLREVEASQLVTLDLDGKVLSASGGARPSKESSMHLAVYSARPDVASVIHVHPPFATAYAVLGVSLPMETVSARLKLGEAPVIPEAEPGSPELSDAVASALRSAAPNLKVLVLKRHGIVAFSRSLLAAYDTAELAEDTARVAFLAGMLPQPRHWRMEVADLSMPLDDRTPIYPTDPGYRSRKHLEHDDDGCNVLELVMGTHTGTHVDVPVHHVPGGKDASGFPLASFIGPAVVMGVDKSHRSLITPEDLSRSDIRPGDIVLVSTGWERFLYAENYFKDFPAFAPQTADFLIEKQVRAVGADIPSVDPAGAAPEFHHVALGAGIGIIEGLVNLEPLRGKRVFFAALPLSIVCGDGSPVRAVALPRTPEV